MKILFINSVCGIGSTGRICTDLATQLEAQGHTVKIAYGRDDTVPPQFEKYAVKIGTALDRNLHALLTRTFDLHGFGSKTATRRFLQWADAYDPDLVWLHNIHGYYIHVEMLFAWIKSRPDMQVKWTLHDCWAFTGHCSYFTAVGCKQWESECKKCPQMNRYPKCYGLGDVGRNYRRKKAAFCGVRHMQLIVPSHWLEGLVKQSFLQEYPVEVVYNTIDTTIFKPTPSNFRQRYGLQGKKMILGVASTWDERKGLNDFVELAGMLDEHYVIVLVGLTPKQMKKMPSNIIGVPRTNSPAELAGIYTAADVFVNLSHEENYPTVNLEAQACGTRVVAYDVGGSRETRKSEYFVVCNDHIGNALEDIGSFTNEKQNRLRNSMG